jgi:hypothetical protein
MFPVVRTGTVKIVLDEAAPGAKLKAISVIR